MRELQEGDVVRLVTGGPSMSLQEIEGHRGTCVWFDDDGRLRERAFLLSALRLEDGGSDLSPVTRSGPTS